MRCQRAVLVTDREKEFNEKYNHGIDLIEAGDLEAGNVALLEAARIAPEGWLALSNRSIKNGEYIFGAARCREILDITKDVRLRAAALNNLGMCACMMGDSESAELYFRKSMSEYPSPDGYSNLALVTQWKGDFKEAVRFASLALSKDHWHEQAAFIRAMCLLMDCDYERGFEEYECRWRSKSNNLKKLACDKPEWDGKASGKIFVYGEQGVGDSILMLRYARKIKELGNHQTWVCQKGMSQLMATMPEIDCAVEPNSPLPDFDYHIPAVSLARVFKTNIDSIPAAPYIPKPEKIDLGEGFHVGIVWRGSKVQTNDAIRSTSLELWKPVLDVEGATFHSLQVDGADEALLYPSIKSHGMPSNWLDTARLVSSMDLVISVDTSTVHLCGALGVECLVPMHCRPYFVYPPKFGSRSPWYQSVELFRQVKPHNWKPVFESIAARLKERIT